MKPRQRQRAVMPLKKEDVEKIFEYLKKNDFIVMYGVVKFALNTGLKMKDILKIKFEDITKKKKNFAYNSACLEVVSLLKEYYFLKNIEPYNEGYLFKSLKKPDEAITYFGVDFYIRKIKKALDIKYPFNTISFKKTWARAVFDEFQDVSMLMKLLNQRSPEETLKYIGIEIKPIENIKVYEKIVF